MHWEPFLHGLRHEPWGLVVAILFGAVLGSFINVVIYRLPRGMSLAHPPSHCPGCGRRVQPWDNIPVLSYLLLRGRCRGCGVRIPLRYPIVELLAAALTVLAVRFAATPPAVLIQLVFVLGLLAVVFIDLDHRIIPDRITLPGIGLGLLWALIGPLPLLDSVLGILVGGGGLFLIAVGYQRITGREGLGMGDVKLMAMVGAFLGWQGALATVLFGSLAGSLVGLGLMVGGRGNRLTALPFGTFLAPAAWVVLFAGEVLWARYLALLMAA
jgi:leader peptidase (prepilin peptidase)/N-methyltransferase